MTKDLCFITVIGEDKKGIIAQISQALYEKEINIEDISQRIREGYFVMTMLADLSESKSDIGELKEKMVGLEKELNLKIQVQHEDIFKKMHRV
ncbi:MAG: ACT domain-containing protein [Candidatus Altiarchaeota archaeon]